MKPTFGNRFCRPLIRASEVVVFPACCLVAATKMGRGRLVVENRRCNIADERAEPLLAAADAEIGIILY